MLLATGAAGASSCCLPTGTRWRPLLVRAGTRPAGACAGLAGLTSPSAADIGEGLTRNSGFDSYPRARSCQGSTCFVEAPKEPRPASQPGQPARPRPQTWCRLLRATSALLLPLLVCPVRPTPPVARVAASCWGSGAPAAPHSGEIPLAMLGDRTRWPRPARAPQGRATDSKRGLPPGG